MNVRMRVSPILILFLALFSLTACNSQSGSKAQADKRAEEARQSIAAQAPPSDGVRRITINELQDALAKGEAVLVDVRGSVEYNLGHIKGARSIPLGLIAQQAGDIPRDKLIVTYCA